MAAGPATIANLTNSIREKFAKPFINLRDSEASFLRRIPTLEWDKATYDWLVRDAKYSALWSANETDQRAFIDATSVATDGVGTATAFLAPNNHPFLRPTITIRMSYEATEVSGLAKAALGGGDAAYVDASADEVEQASVDFWRNLNTLALSTATTSGNSGKNIDGIGVVMNTTSYAGLAVASVPEWLPYVDTTTAAVSIAAWQTAWNNLAAGAQTLGTGATIRQANIREIWVSPNVYTNYGNLMTSMRVYGPKDTLDGGVGDLAFNGTRLVQITEFPANYAWFYGGGLYFIILKAFDVQDKSANKVDADFRVLSQYSNIVLRSRKDQGLYTALAA